MYAMTTMESKVSLLTKQKKVSKFLPADGSAALKGERRASVTW